MDNFIIKKILKEQLDERNNNPLDKREVKFFKILNREKHKYPTQKELLNYIRDMMVFIGKSPSDARFYYEVYTQNYRPEGDYENLTFDEFKNYKDFKQRRISNSTAYEYSSAKMPFKGSNLEGSWEVRRNNQWYYVVESYGWYPIFLFINDKWYGNIDSYSSSTAKQMRNVNPTHYNTSLKDEVTYVRKVDLDNLIRGLNYDEINQNRLDDFIRNFKDVGKSKLITIGRWGDNRKKARFRIMEMNKEDDILNITVYVDKAGKMINNKMVDNVEDYTEEFANEVEQGVEDYIIRTYREYLTPENTKFRFIHP
jgi:hypothetical protein